MMKPEDQELRNIREEIDSIDEEILSLFKRRMDCARRVAQVKIETGQPVYHPEREHEILERVGNRGEGYSAAAQALFANIMELSRALQSEMMDCDMPLTEQIKNAPETICLKPGQAVACQGMAGAFSDEAAGMLFPSAPKRFYPRFSDVFDALVRGECPVAVLPAENSSAGSVGEVYELLRQQGMYIVDSVNVPVHHCLCALPGVTVAEIKTVYSHPQALAQCSGWIQKSGVTAREHTNTAAAAEMVAQRGERSYAALCSRRAAEEYGLTIVLDAVHNEEDNCTRFVVISREMITPPDAGRISVCFALPHTRGALYRILQRFALQGHNLTRIESAPIADQPFAYRFFVDFEGDVRDYRVVRMMCALSRELPEFSFLGATT